jgi:hypothetical protein
MMPQGGQGGPVEFRTKAGRDAQVVNNAISSISQFAGQLKQKQWNKKAARAEQAWQSHLSLQQAINATDDPKAKQMLQQQLQQMMEDPKIGKIFSKAHEDPTSPEGVGIQRAMSMSQQQAKQKLDIANIQSQIQQRQAEAAKARALTPQTDQERAVQMGTAPSADVIEQSKARIQAQKDALEFRKDALAQQKELTLQRLEDQRATAQDRMQLARELAQIKKQEVESQMQFKQMQWEEKSKIPTVIGSRVNQALIVKEQLSDLMLELNDKNVTKYMGPVVGIAAPATRRLSSKVQEFVASQESLDALLPILHGYRGGAQMHQTFRQAMGTLSFDPEAYKGTLRALDSMADNIIKEVKQAYPNDPIWKNLDVSPGKSGQAITDTSQPVIHKMD